MNKGDEPEPARIVLIKGFRDRVAAGNSEGFNNDMTHTKSAPACNPVAQRRRDRVSYSCNRIVGARGRRGQPIKLTQPATLTM